MNRARPKQQELPVAQAPLLRSEGQRMLLHVSGSLAAIAAAIGSRSPRSILDWRNGVRVPHVAARAQMEATLGIPALAWSQLPHTGEADAEVLEPERDNAPLPTLAQCLQLLSLIQKDRSSPALMPGERAKLIDAEARILKLRADLEQRAELSEDRYVREHPAWIRARNEIARVLVAYPAAARAVAEALERLGV